MLPKLFMFREYIIYFWSSDICEPIHVHISKRKPAANATKIWITRTGECILASNGSRIPNDELKKIMRYVSFQSFHICKEWKRRFGIDEIVFYR